MHRAPAVGFTVARSRSHLCVIVILLSLGCVSSLLLMRTALELDALVLAVACWICVGGVSLKSWQNFQPSRLQWDGQQWLVSGLDSARALHLDLLLDFQSLMLVRVRGKSVRTVWLWLEPTLADSSWLALRRAVVAGQRTQQPNIATDSSKLPGDPS
jgi:hypothetical protein